MSKSDSILVNSMDSSSSIAVGIWDGSTPGILKALNPHRHDHYTCMLVEAGPLEVQFDFEPLTMPAATLFICPPHQVHQITGTLGASGYYISFEGRHITRTAKDVLDASLHETIIVSLAAPEQQWFTSVLDSLINLHSINNIVHQDVQQPLLSAFITQAVICQQRKVVGSLSHSPRIIGITNAFRNLVRSDYRSLKRPSDYAEKLNISVAYLNDIVKNVTGLSASALIQKEILSEAQRLLYYSPLSIKEISVQLGYKDTKYFIRLFTKKAGRSPGDYRKALRPNPDLT
ncbi:helix-turn-helix domain-containing protein [Sphingobacterium sp. UBA1498]|uniref:helix-turn-helix domain-containing protein n=1 Tax=Sphingobacterium sp. UBA1498 TaxID=1947481 RepID=UPI0025EE0A41|nr:helix-turn-helix transcriptional regulator [Sphingobacterium sp. UBA1498]